jgi:hypothetical protein
MAKPIMARATAVWLVDNTTLTFKQIADFVEMHELEVQGIADGDVAVGVKGFDPIANNQLEAVEITKGEADPLHKLKLKFNPELSDAQISKLIGTTKPTIQAIRERAHWNIANITPIDPVALGLCKQSELDLAVQKAAAKKAAEGTVMSDDERRKLVSTEQSLDMPAEPKIPSAIEGLEAFSLNDPKDDSEDSGDDNEYLDADSFFNLPGDDGDEQPDV